MDDPLDAMAQVLSDHRDSPDLGLRLQLDNSP